jgi:hypothetical protein
MNAIAPRVSRPWRPHVLDAHDLSDRVVAALAYVVVDEIEDGTVLLTLTPWPVADARGRLRFPALDRTREVALDQDVLQAELYDGWLERQPRVGDVFAFTPRAPLPDADPTSPARIASLTDVVKGPVYDLSAEARKVAKLAFYAVTADPLDQREAERTGLADTVDDDRDPAPRHPGIRRKGGRT